MTSPDVVIVPHTHWDREWYEPFQRFRFLLVEMFDDVLTRLEQDPQFRFTLDGQTAAIEDYLAIRPEHRQRVIDRVRSGQLALGPFHILLDEFLCSGETIVRNLRLGIAGAEQLGGAMPAAYLPDMFGHIAQMPQILRLSGIADAVLWRGVPRRIESHAFNWVAPSGHSVRAEYLFDGYANGLALTSQPGSLLTVAPRYGESTYPRFGGEPVLAMVGSDHTSPAPELMAWVRAASSGGLRVSVATLAEYLARCGPASESVNGELRSHAHGNILPGVISVRRPLKVAMAAAERSLLTAERLALSWSERRFDVFFDLGWRLVVESTAHDSVVGSGSDPTVRQVHCRLEEAEQIGRAIRDATLREMATAVPSGSVAVINTLPWRRVVTAEFDVDADTEPPLQVRTADGACHTVQVLDALPTELGNETIVGRLLARLLHRIHGSELYGRRIHHVDIGAGTLTFHVIDGSTTNTFESAELRRLITERAADETEWQVKILARPRLRVVCQLPIGPMAMLAAVVEPAAASASTPFASADTDTDTVTLSNGVVSVVLTPDGLATIVGEHGVRLEGVGRIVDGGDRGDSYNYGPPAADETIERPASVSVTVEHTGPVLARAAVHRWYEWPIGLSDDLDKRSGVTTTTQVITRYELRAGEPIVRVRVSFVNLARNHRTRFHIPLPGPARASASMGQFAVTTRGLQAEGGGGEYPLPTFPAYDFVSAGPVTVLLREATEYELVDAGRELALTLLRAVGMISVNVHPLRDEPAAGEVPIPGGQENGTDLRADYGILVHQDGWEAAGAVEWAQSWLADAIVISGRRESAEQPSPVQAVEVTGLGVGLGALRRVDASTDEIRLIGYHASPSTARLDANYADVEVVDLLGRAVDTPDLRHIDGGGWEIPVGPASVVTLRATRCGAGSP